MDRSFQSRGRQKTCVQTKEFEEVLFMIQLLENDCDAAKISTESLRAHEVITGYASEYDFEKRPRLFLRIAAPHLHHPDQTAASV